jgi:hypothetical protein
MTIIICYVTGHAHTPPVICFMIIYALVLVVSGEKRTVDQSTVTSSMINEILHPNPSHVNPKSGKNDFYST